MNDLPEAYADTTEREHTHWCWSCGCDWSHANDWCECDVALRVAEPFTCPECEQ